MGIGFGISSNGGMMPVYTSESSPPPKCPECGKLEHIKQVCKHCGYVYPEEKPWPWWKVVLLVTVICAAIWLGTTVLIWLYEQDSNRERYPTLLGMFVKQWEFVRALRIW